MEYRIVIAYGQGSNKDNMKLLEEQVNDLIDQGWKPQGGVGFADMNASTAVQAMIREIEN